MSSVPHRIHVVSARTSNNPYALLNVYCTKVKTREHAQFVGILSFALFICLTVASFVIYEVDSIFFIIFGIFIYAFLTESLFRIPRPCGVLLYLVFETLQIGFYIANIIFILVELIFSSYGWYDCDEYDDDSLENQESATTNTSSPSTSTLPPCQLQHYETWVLVMGLLTFFFLMVIKLYFIKVFTQYYKMINYQEQHSNELRAQYVNGRGVNLGFPDPAFGNPVINDPGYGYSLYQAQPNPLPELPDYHQAMTTSKPFAASTPDASPPHYTGQVEPSSQNSSTVP